MDHEPPLTPQTRQPGDLIGDYRLRELLSEGQLTRTWQAEQISMQRLVVIEMLKQVATTNPQLIDGFLADVRAKALINHPGIGSVYEAISSPEATFFAREIIDGPTLEALYENQHKFTPLETVKLLEQICRAMIYLEENHVATVEFGLHHFHLGPQGHLRLTNLAVDGPRDETANTKTKQLLGEVFDEMLLPNHPGHTRVHSLCGFMADLDRPAPLTWSQISSLATQVRQQLEGTHQPAPVAPAHSYQPTPTPFKIPTSFWALLGGLALVIAMITFMVMTSNPTKPTTTEEAPKNEPFVEIPPGDYPLTPEQTVKITKPFKIYRTEVTIAQYNAFLQFPDLAKFAHPDQPASKTSHEPDDWANLWPAAVKKETWNGRPVSTDCPIVGIDWWDAFAFAQWSQARLPTLAEWSVAAQFQNPPSGLADWGKVDQTTPDQTGSGILAMAGGVKEWTLDPEVDPAFPLSPKKPVIVGASFRDPAEGIKARFFLDDLNHRSDDLGLRLVLEP